MTTLATIGGGGGGFEAGAVEAGLTPVWSVECDAEIAAVHERNFKARMIVERAEDVDFTAQPSPFWLHMSPVCKNASVAKKDGKEESEDVSMAEACARAVRDCRASIVSIENVWGYRNFDSFRLILKALEESGYAFDFWHLNAADYGVPQTRKRLILLASKTHRPRRPQSTHRERADLFLPKWRGWYEAIEDLIPTLPESKFAEWQLKRLPELMKRGVLVDSKNAGQEFGKKHRTHSEPALTVTADTRPAHQFRAFIVGQNYGSPNDSGRERILNTREAGEPIFTIESNPNRLNTRAFLVGGANTSEMQAAAGVGVSVADEPSRCVNASNSLSWRGWLSQGRVVSMTPRALARFQSIPDWFVLPERVGLACKVIGNAVASLLARRLVESVVTERELAA
jgi:DNA (cytosine-5)-methyltransferase 1